MAFEEVKIEFHLGRTRSEKVHIFNAGTESIELSLCGKADLQNIPILKIYTIADIEEQIKKTEADPVEFTLKSELPELFCERCRKIFEKDYIGEEKYDK